MDAYDTMVFYSYCNKLFNDNPNLSYVAIAELTGHPAEEVAIAFKMGTYPKWRGKTIRLPNADGTIQCTQCLENKFRWEFKPDNTQRYGVAKTCLSCKPSKKPGRPVTRTITDGQATCTECHKLKPLKAFHKHRARPHGIEYRCKQCINPTSTPHEDHTDAMAALLAKIGPERALEHIKAAEGKLRTLKRLVSEVQA